MPTFIQLLTSNPDRLQPGRSGTQANAQHFNTAARGQAGMQTAMTGGRATPRTGRPVSPSASRRASPRWAARVHRRRCRQRGRAGPEGSGHATAHGRADRAVSGLPCVPDGTGVPGPRIIRRPLRRDRERRESSRCTWLRPHVVDVPTDAGTDGHRRGPGLCPPDPGCRHRAVDRPALPFLIPCASVVRAGTKLNNSAAATSASSSTRSGPTPTATSPSAGSGSAARPGHDRHTNVDNLADPSAGRPCSRSRPAVVPSAQPERGAADGSGRAMVNLDGVSKTATERRNGT